MKNLFKTLTFVFVVSLIAPACAPDDDFNDMVVASELDQSTTASTNDKEEEQEKPGGN
ncbi:hypothetical protein [Marinoscillum furvescens]|uniref:Secreted protein n=1 Tax=Marinoscillum furvescens DSM 4134 TaxID=1122208 RepID=A0A3D9KX28_MARFU|nr:hypothetical protein [Marinoscillum furvescens]RED92827.1 hypothetical protein C7460_12844 [Marinoscillum furvescens DSM 4134]